MLLFLVSLLGEEGGGGERIEEGRAKVKGVRRLGQECVRLLTVISLY